MGYDRHATMEVMGKESKGSSDYDESGGSSQDEGSPIGEQRASDDGSQPGVQEDDGSQPVVQDESEACQTPSQSSASGAKVQTVSSPFQPPAKRGKYDYSGTSPFGLAKNFA